MPRVTRAVPGTRRNISSRRTEFAGDFRTLSWAIFRNGVLQRLPAALAARHGVDEPSWHNQTADEAYWPIATTSGVAVDSSGCARRSRQAVFHRSRPVGSPLKVLS